VNKKEFKIERLIPSGLFQIDLNHMMSVHCDSMSILTYGIHVRVEITKSQFN